MNEILNKIQMNLAQLMSKSSTEFKNPEDLIKFIFLGENAEQNIKSSAETAKTTVNEEKTKELLKGLLDENSETILKNLEDVLTQLSTPTQPQDQA